MQKDFSTASVNNGHQANHSISSSALPNGDGGMVSRASWRF
jgi:hypothetical protein